ncbi:MAG: GAF domain-containing protein [Candidatus Flexifilum sp.]|jgi:GAF domain-containing protein
MWQRLFPVNQYDKPSERSRARLFYAVGTALTLLRTFYFAFLPSPIGTETVLRGALSGDLLSLIIVIGTYGSWLLMMITIRTGRLGAGAVFTVSQAFFSGFLMAFVGGFNDANEGMMLLIFVVLAGLIMRERGVIIGTSIALGGLAVRVLAGSSGLFSADTLPTREAASAAIVTLGTGLLVYLFLYAIRINRLEASIQSSEEQLRLAAITTKIATLVNRRQPLESVLRTAIDEILRGYPTVYHAQIFLNDEANEYARLVASTGEVGQLLLSRKHALAVGSQSVIGQVTATGKPIIARAGAKDGIHKRNELLPDTQVELALPLIVEDRVIGALDVQSRQIESFLEVEIPTLEALADTVAVAINNARLYEERERQLAENEALVAQMQSAMTEVERLNQQLTGLAWAEYLRPQQDAVNLDYTGGAEVQPNLMWTPTLLEAVESGAVVQRQEGDEFVVSLPVRVRGVVIGAAEYVFPRPVEPETLGLLQTALDRFSTAAESLRLFEDAQRATAQEQRVNDIALRYQQVTGIDELLSLTVAELSQTLGARAGSIRLGRLQPETNGAAVEGAAS